MSHLLHTAATLACALALGAAGPITFTGNVPLDFSVTPPFNPEGVMIATDVKPPLTFVSNKTGWDLVDIRFAYDAVTDTGYFGVNTGPCITGDADCDGDASHTSATLAAEGGVDEHRFDLGEFGVVVVDFDPAYVRVDEYALPATRIAIGVPVGPLSGAETLSTIRAAHLSNVQPRNAFGSVLSNTVTYFNAPVGPDAAHPHLEFSVSQFSTIPLQLGLPWIGAHCVNFGANFGSGDDGPFGEDNIPMQQACLPPSASPSPSPSTSPSPTPSLTSSPSSTPSTSPSASPSETPSPSASSSPSVTTSPSATPTASDLTVAPDRVSRSRTPSKSPSRSLTASRSASRNNSKTSSTSITASKSRSGSRTASKSVTATRSKTKSRSATQTRSSSKKLR